MRPVVARNFAIAGCLLTVVGSLTSNPLIHGTPLPLGIAVAAALLIGARKNGTNSPLAWMLLAVASFMIASIEETVWIFQFFTNTENAKFAGAILGLFGVLVATGGMGLLVKARKTQFRLPTMLDSLLLISASSAVLWSLIAQVDTTTDRSTLLVSATIMFGLFALLFRMGISGSRFPSFHYYLCSVTIALIGTLIAGVLGEEVFRPFAEWCWSASIVFLGSTALHPTMVKLSEPQESSENTQLGKTQVILLGVALAAGPAVTLIGHVRGVPMDVFGAVASVVLAVLAVSRFATLVLERDRAQSQMVHSQERLHALVSNSFEAIIIIAEDRTVTYVSPPFERLFAMAAEDFVGANLDDWMSADNYPEAYEAITRILSDISHYERFELLSQKADGEKIWLTVQMTDARHDEAIGGIICNMADITWRKKAEAEVHGRALQQEALADLARSGLQGGGQVQDILFEAVKAINNTLNSSLVTVWEVNPTGDLATLRAAAGKTEGLDSEIEEAANDGSPEGRTLLAGSSMNFPSFKETNFSDESFALTQGFASAGCVIISGAGSTYGVLAVYGDETQVLTASDISFMESVANVIAVVLGRVNSEHELQQAQKLESVGRLAAGIAHEINTPIQFVGDNLHFLSDAFNELIEAAQGNGEADLEYLAEEVPTAAAQSLDGVQRVASIVRAMKAFGHPDTAEMKMNDVNEALRNTLVVARNEIKYVADVKTHFAEIPPVKSHIGELNQVFLNLLVNASHAIGDKIKNEPNGRGQIMVRTWRDKDDVVIAIGDTGGGIPPEIRNRVFDPFFTTKEVGRGTGQGLALAKVVVAKHGGTIRFDTDSSGTIFCIKLPIGEQS